MPPMRLNLFLVTGLVVVLALPATRLQAVPCSQGHEACCCPDEAACPCAHDQDDAPPPPAESTPRLASERALPGAQAASTVIAPDSPVAESSLAAQPGAAPHDLLLLLATYRC